MVRNSGRVPNTRSAVPLGARAMAGAGAWALAAIVTTGAADAPRVLSAENQFRRFGFCDDGRTIAATDGKLVWRIEWPSGTLRPSSEPFSLEKPPCVLRALGSSADGKWWAAQGSGGAVTVRDASTGAMAQTLAADIAATRSVVFSPDGHWLASGGLDNDIHVWDVRTWKEATTLSTLSHATFALGWSPDSKTLFASGASRTVTAIVAGTWTVARSSTPLKFALTQMAVSPDGKTLAVAGFDPLSSALPSAVRVLDASSLVERRSIPTDTEVDGLAYSPDGKSLLVLVSGRKGILIWPVE
jgi:WD40 repeat protein